MAKRRTCVLPIPYFFMRSKHEYQSSERSLPRRSTSEAIASLHRLSGEALVTVHLHARYGVPHTQVVEPAISVAVFLADFLHRIYRLRQLRAVNECVLDRLLVVGGRFQLGFRLATRAARFGCFLRRRFFTVLATGRERGLSSFSLLSAALRGAVVFVYLDHVAKIILRYYGNPACHFGSPECALINQIIDCPFAHSQKNCNFRYCQELVTEYLFLRNLSLSLSLSFALRLSLSA